MTSEAKAAVRVGRSPQTRRQLGQQQRTPQALTELPASGAVASHLRAMPGFCPPDQCLLRPESYMSWCATEENAAADSPQEGNNRGERHDQLAQWF